MDRLEPDFEGDMYEDENGRFIRYEEAQQQISELTAMVESIKGKLLVATVASCSCLTKTPAVTHHNVNCTYRKIMGIVHDIETAAQPQALTAHDNAIRVEVEDEAYKTIDDRLVQILMLSVNDNEDEQYSDGLNSAIEAIRTLARKYKEE